MHPLIILSGPTASGKSNVAQALAEHLDTEIIGADSMQVYRHFDIGTAKPGLEERRRVRHHLIDILEPDEEFTAFDFKEQALERIRDIRGRNRTPVMVGGTGLYLKTLLENRDCAISVSPEIRQQVQEEILQKGTHAMHAELAAIDPVYAGKIQPTDPVRIGRALSVHRETGKRLSEFHAEDRPADYEFDSYLFVLETERKFLYEKIDRRVDAMLDSGLKTEVESLLNRGWSSRLKPFQSIGYSHMVRHLEEGLPLDRAVYEMKRDTRHFAKRQLTWFGKMAGRIPVWCGPGDTVRGIMENILSQVTAAAACLLGLFLFLTNPLPAGAASEGWFQSGVHEFQAGQWDNARGLLEKLLMTGVDAPTQKRARFLLAKAYLEQKNFADAKIQLENVLREYPEMEDYIRLDLARTHQSQQEWESALKQTDIIMKKLPHTLLVPDVRLLRAEIYEKLEDYPKAILELREAETLITRKFSSAHWKSKLSDIVNRQIELQKLLKDYNKVYALYRHVYIRYPEMATRLQARLQMDQMEKLLGLPAQPLSEREHRRRIRGLLRKVLYTEVIEELETLEKDRPETPLSASMYFYLAEAYKGLRNRPGANRVLEKFLKKYPEHSRVPEAHFLMAGNLWNLGNPKEALKHIQMILESHSKSQWVPQALYYQGRIYEDIHSPSEALDAYKILIQDHNQEFEAETSAWRSGWIHYRSQRWLDAYSQFKENLRLFKNGEETDKNYYWMSKAAEKLERGEEALQLLREAAERFPYTYYGLQARNRLNELAPGSLPDPAPYQKASFEEDSSQPLKRPGRPLSTRERFHFKHTVELIHLGFFPEARTELLRLARSIRKNYSGTMWLSHWFNRAEGYSHSMRLLQMIRDLKTIHKEKELPRSFWINFYPSAYSDFIRTETAKHDLDPWLVEGLIRQESMYDTRSLSPAGARGLMQIMPKTAKRLYAKTNPENEFEEDLLYQPDINIQLGVQYLNDLMRKHKGDGVYILITYNAGPKVLQAWLKRFNSISDRDVFIESIPYPETRGYVKRVLRNYGVYKNLYPDHRAPLSGDKTF